jgi:hypothetical protein
MARLSCDRKYNIRDCQYVRNQKHAETRSDYDKDPVLFLDNHNDYLAVCGHVTVSSRF